MWLWGAFTPHPPIIVPEVGRGNEREAQSTVDGMLRLAEGLRGLEPERLLVFTPHQIYREGLLMLAADRFVGDLSQFGAPQVRIQMEGDKTAAATLESYLRSHKVPVHLREGSRLMLDHATVVPLYFLAKAWGKVPPAILANPIGLTYKESYRLGELLRDFDDGAKWGLLCSGDLSHRLIPGAPAGYNPRAMAFDRTVIESLRKSSPEPIWKLSPLEIEEAGECGLRSALILLGAARGEPIDVISYEGPFGVGYGVALWQPVAVEKKTRDDLSPHVKLARLTLERYLSQRRLPSREEVSKTLGESATRQLESQRRAAFVSLKTRDKNLRGCIGTIVPAYENLLREIMHNAVAAATEDPRFPPVRQEELEELVISVDVLSEPETVSSIDELDPKRYGVIVAKGHARGVLLPDLEGVDTPQEQLSIAAQKAGIRSLEGATIYRFTVERYEEA